MKVFVDTNVLVYTRDLTDPAKRLRANEWVSALDTAGRLVISVQVLNEFGNVMIRKLPGPLLAQLESAVVEMARWCTARMDASVTKAAIAIHRRYGFQWWDSLIVATADRARCDVLLTEDLQAGQLINGLRVVNPFDTSPDFLPH